MTTILDAAKALHGPIRAAVPQMQADRKIPHTVVDGMRAAGVFDMALPQSLGGPELSPLEQFDVIEALSISDASVGWCAMIGADSGYYPGFLDDDAFATLYPTRNLVTAGKIAPAGVAQRCPGGWKVTGHWDFGSGSTHADRFVGGVFLHDEEGESISDGRLCAAYLPTELVEVQDTWDTIGLRATASNDYEIVDAVVPDNWLFDVMAPMQRDDPIYRLPSWFIYKVAGVLTGLARRALDEAIVAATDKTLFPEFIQLIDRPGTQETIARNEAEARSARSFVREEIAKVWDACVHEGDLSPKVLVPMRLAMVQASQVAVRVCREMFDLMTTTSIRSDSVHAQLMADAAVANTHIATSHRSWAPLGARLSGRTSGGPLFL